jgi:DNA-binding MarR family transcriptional regulator
MSRFDFYRDLEKQTKVRLLTCEAEILFNLALSPLTAGELQARSRNSSTSFYMTLKKLSQMSLIIGLESKDDRRRVVYHLADDLRTSMATGTAELSDS